MVVTAGWRQCVTVLNQDEAYSSGMFMASGKRTGLEKCKDLAPMVIFQLMCYLGYQMTTPHLPTQTQAGLLTIGSSSTTADGQDNEQLRCGGK